MKSKLLHDRQGERAFALVFDSGDEVISLIRDFAKRHDLNASHFTAIGGHSAILSSATSTGTARSTSESRSTSRSRFCQ